MKKALILSTFAIALVTVSAQAACVYKSDSNVNSEEFNVINKTSRNVIYTSFGNIARGQDRSQVVISKLDTEELRKEDESGRSYPTTMGDMNLLVNVVCATQQPTNSKKKSVFLGCCTTPSKNGFAGQSLSFVNKKCVKDAINLVDLTRSIPQ